MSIALSIDLNSIYYLPDWVCHPTIIDRKILFQREGAEQGRGEWGEVQRRHPWAVGVLQQRDRFARSAIKVRCSRCEAPKPYISNNNDKLSNNDIKRPDNLNDGTEDTNHNGRIDGDNGDGKYQDTETWEETNPNDDDTDGDTFKDDDEIEWKYDPKKADTDSDGINDNVEDINGDGSFDNSEYSGETNPLEMDSDGDGLIDKQEKDGWVVVIIRESTGEQVTRRDVFSNPRLKHSDGDQIDDFSEFKNATDPKNTDTDGDGKDDYVEIIEYEESSPWGIDGTPPEIIDIEKDYDIKWGGLFGVIPQGVELKLKITARDDFGMKWINVWVEKLGEKKVYFSDEQEVTSNYNFDIESDDASNFLYKGFKINVSAMDRNENLGFKNVKMPGITEMVMNALLGPLLSIVKAISELISNMCDWLYDLPGMMLEGLLQTINSIKDLTMNQINSYLQPIKNFFINGYIGDIDTMLNNFIESVINLPLFTIAGIIMVTAMVIEMIVNGVTFGAAAIVGIILAIIISLLTIVLMVSEDAKETVGNFMSNLISSIVDSPMWSKEGSKNIENIGGELTSREIMIGFGKIFIGIIGKIFGRISGFSRVFIFSTTYNMELVGQWNGGADFLYETTSKTSTHSATEYSASINPAKLKNVIFINSLGWAILSAVLSFVASMLYESIKKFEKTIDYITFAIACIAQLGGIICAGISFYYNTMILTTPWYKSIGSFISLGSIGFSIITLLFWLGKFGLEMV